MDPSASTPAHPLSNFTPQDDPSKFIRTYAKDFAALSANNTEGAEAPAPPPPSPVSSPAPKDTKTVEGVSLPDFDPSPINHADGASPKEFEQESVDLKASDSDGIFANKGAAPAPVSSPAMPLMPQAAIALAPNVEPSTEPMPEADAERESILARLRAKVASQQNVAPAVQEVPLRTAAPDFKMTPEPILPMPPVHKEEVIPVPQPAAPEVSSPIHTYSSDFADHIDSEKSSTFSVLAAQSDAGQTPRSETPRKRTFVPLLAGGAMLIIGIGAILGAYLFTQNGAVTPIVAGIPSLIQFDESVEVKGTGPALMQAIADVASGGSVQGNVIVTYVTLATSTGSGIPQPGGVLIKNLNLAAPDILLRNIDQSSTVGVIHAGAEARPFMILKVNSYERTFAGMLAWEPTMAANLAAFYPAYSSMQAQSTSSSSTTPTIFAPNPTSFTDSVVANYDVRVLRDASGRSRLLYGYHGKNTLIIARDEAAFASLVSRLKASGE